MRIDKVILRAAMSTLLAIVVLFGVMIFALCYLFPSTMMNITYDLGMDCASITCAKRSYNRSGEVYYIAFATETAIVSGDYEEIADCGKHLIEDDGQAFEKYCQEKTAELSGSFVGDYEQYIYGQICVAEYSLGDKDKAIEDAFLYLQGAFPVNNGAVALLLTAIAQNDAETVLQIQQRMQTIEQSGLSAQDKAYFLSTMQAIGNNE